MHRLLLRIALLALLTLSILPPMACATNGYFSHGVGIKAKGMAGATLALPQDALAGGNNPAALSRLERRFDLGVDWFRPDRSSEITGNMNDPLNTVYDGNASQDFFIPEAGYCQPLNEELAFGVSLYGNGGMNTDYTTAIGLFGTSPAGVDLSQLFIAPTLAYAINEDHSFGVAFNIGWQRFKASGLENFDNANYSSAPGSVTNNDYESSWGFGARLGWLGQLTESLAAAAFYQSRSAMGNLEAYKGLFAEQGGFDIPSSFGAGLAYSFDRANIAFDYGMIRYSEIKSIANPLLPNLGQAPLGDDGGAGFGWEDVNVFKVGADFAATEMLTLRGGFNYGAQPIPQAETLFNMLAPGIVESHIALGASLAMDSGGEISFAFMHAFENTVSGQNSIIPGAPPQGMGGGEANITLAETSFGLAYGMSF